MNANGHSSISTMPKYHQQSPWFQSLLIHQSNAWMQKSPPINTMHECKLNHLSIQCMNANWTTYQYNAWMQTQQLIKTMHECKLNHLSIQCMNSHFTAHQYNAGLWISLMFRLLYIFTLSANYSHILYLVIWLRKGQISKNECK